MSDRVESPKTLRSRVSALMNSIKGGRSETSVAAEQPETLTITAYNLILMDPDGQVLWTQERDAGGAFEFGPRSSLRIFCEFTNRSDREAEIAEYEIELMGKDGLVVGRFNNSFGDTVVVGPGETRVLSGQWQL